MADKKIMSTVGFMPAVESVSRKFALRRETCSVKKVGRKIIMPFSYMGSSVRTQNLVGYGVVSKNVLFMRKFARTSPLTEDEITARNWFKKAAQATAFQLKDLTQITRMTTLFLGAKNDLTKTVAGVSVKGYDYRGWVFAVNYVRAQASVQDINTFPTEYGPAPVMPDDSED